MLKRFIRVLISTLYDILLNGKTWFMFIMLLILLWAIWSNAMQIEWYNSAHGRIISYNPRTQAIYTIIKTITISGIIFIFFLVKQTVKKLK